MLQHAAHHAPADAFAASAFLSTVQHDLQCQHHDMKWDCKSQQSCRTGSLSTPTPQTTNKTTNLHYTTTKYKTIPKKHGFVAVCSQSPG
jgi:hypothetical protein